jgi:hypothetical protein
MREISSISKKTIGVSGWLGGERQTKNEVAVTNCKEQAETPGTRLAGRRNASVL